MAGRHIKIWVFAQLVFLSSGLVMADDYALQRQEMLNKIEDGLRTTSSYIDKKSFNIDVKFNSVISCYFKNIHVKGFEVTRLNFPLDYTFHSKPIAFSLTSHNFSATALSFACGSSLHSPTGPVKYPRPVGP